MSGENWEASTKRLRHNIVNNEIRSHTPTLRYPHPNLPRYAPRLRPNSDVILSEP
jgi:hypothetical protein